MGKRKGCRKGRGREVRESNGDGRGRGGGVGAGRGGWQGEERQYNSSDPVHKTEILN